MKFQAFFSFRTGIFPGSSFNHSTIPKDLVKVNLRSNFSCCRVTILPYKAFFL